MASAAEQMAANMNWGAMAKATELKQRILFVLFALIIYRIGTYIPLPGVDPEVWGQVFDQKGGGILDMFNMFSGGACIEYYAIYFGIDYHAAWFRNGATA
jgi:preprotein translocase subunit SecY